MASANVGLISQTVEYNPAGNSTIAALLDPTNLWWVGGTECPHIIGYQGQAFFGVGFSYDLIGYYQMNISNVHGSFAVGNSVYIANMSNNTLAAPGYGQVNATSCTCIVQTTAGLQSNLLSNFNSRVLITSGSLAQSTVISVVANGVNGIINSTAFYLNTEAGFTDNTTCAVYDCTFGVTLGIQVQAVNSTVMILANNFLGNSSHQFPNFSNTVTWNLNNAYSYVISDSLNGGGTGAWCQGTPAYNQISGAQIWTVQSETSQPVHEASFSQFEPTISAMVGANFTAPFTHSFAAASTYNTLGYNILYVRDDFASAWQFAQVISKNAPNSNAQIRSMFVFTDPVTNNSMLFLGDTPNGIYSLQYNANNPGKLANAVLELNTTAFTKITGATDVRISSFAMMANILYATIGNEIWQRTNGVSPSWSLAWTDTDYASSQTGLRGLTPGPTNTAFLVGREGTNAAILAITPGVWTPTSQYNQAQIANLLELTYQEEGSNDVLFSYSIPFYEPMFRYTSNNGNTALLGTWCAFLNPGTGTANTPTTYNEPSATNAYAYPLYLTFNNDGLAEWHINQLQPSVDQTMVTIRSIAHPFVSGNDLWFAGNDPLGNANHTSGWVIKTSKNTLTNQRIT